jgi:hypothetical protein
MVPRRSMLALSRGCDRDGGLEVPFTQRLASLAACRVTASLRLRVGGSGTAPVWGMSAAAIRLGQDPDRAQRKGPGPGRLTGPGQLRGAAAALAGASESAASDAPESNGIGDTGRRQPP